MEERELRFFSSWICFVDLRSFVRLIFSVCALSTCRVFCRDDEAARSSHLLRLPATALAICCRAAMVSGSVSRVPRSACKKQSSRFSLVAYLPRRASSESLSLSLTPRLAKSRSW